jgi:hypothetical protein
MAHAHAFDHSADDGEVRGAAQAAPRLTPLRLAATAVAAIAELMRESVGADFSNGAIAVGALLPSGAELPVRQLSGGGLLADGDDRRVLYLVPLGPDGDATLAESLMSQLREAGLETIASAPRHTAEEVDAALQEAAILLALLAEPDACLRAHEQTYRLLIGVLLRDPGEVGQLRDSTVATLQRYDGAHDTDLVATLETFLANHGSTTDTAETMGLHRHTVGYRLARVQEVSGLSPYESEGRERLSLGLKAQRILLADASRPGRS